MKHKLPRLAERREFLVKQAAMQRIALAQGIEPWRTPLAVADQGLAALRFVGQHPAWVIAGSVLLVWWWPGLGGKWLRRGWLAWQIVHKLRGR